MNEAPDAPDFEAYIGLFDRAHVHLYSVSERARAWIEGSWPEKVRDFYVVIPLATYVDVTKPLLQSAGYTIGGDAL